MILMTLKEWLTRLAMLSEVTDDYREQIAYWRNGYWQLMDNYRQLMNDYRQLMNVNERLPND